MRNEESNEIKAPLTGALCYYDFLWALSRLDVWSDRWPPALLMPVCF